MLGSWTCERLDGREFDSQPPHCRVTTLSPVHTSNNVEATRNIVEATFDFVEATFDIVKRIVKLVAFDNVASTLLLMWTGL